MTFLTDSLLTGVVPIFVNAGAAVLPAILAGLASAVALLFKPKELLRLFVRKPQIPVVFVLILVALYFGGSWVMAATAPASAGRPTADRAGGTATTQTDWAQVALELIRQKQRQQAGLGARPAAKDQTAETKVTPETAAEAAPLIFRGDEQRSGYLGGGSPKGLVLDWEYIEPNTMYLSSPLVAGGSVYGASAYLDPPRSYGSIFALDADTGQRRWELEVKKEGSEDDFMGFFSSPALTADGRYLIIGQGLHPDAGAELVCVETETGRVKWLVPTPLHVESSPAIEGDIVVAGAGAIEQPPDHRPQGDPEGIGHPGYVFAVRISDGKELWRYQLNDPESSPAIRDGIAYIGSGVNGSAVAALHIASDEELATQGLERLVWKVPTPHPAIGPVTLYEDLVLIGGGNGDFVFAAPNPEGVLLALDRQTGETRWSVEFPDAILNAIAVHGDIAICPVRNGEVVAVDLKEQGKVLWRQRISGDRPILGAPAFTGTHVYAVSSDGYLGVIDAANGNLLERVYINTEGRPGELGLSMASPLVVDGSVFIGSETGGIRRYSGSQEAK